MGLWQKTSQGFVYQAKQLHDFGKGSHLITTIREAVNTVFLSLTCSLHLFFLAHDYSL